MLRSAGVEGEKKMLLVLLFSTRVRVHRFGSSVEASFFPLHVPGLRKSPRRGQLGRRLYPPRAASGSSYFLIFFSSSQ